jgi:SAM-dependent methyltransferase
LSTPKEESTYANSSLMLNKVPLHKADLDRFRLGKKMYYKAVPTEKGNSHLCLDIACGAKPFPKADVLCDLNAKPVPDRSMKNLVTNGKPFVLCSCYSLPFRDKAFRFVTSYYLIEHIDNPGVLFKELKRVSRHGYIQAPSWLNEILYGEDVHKWIVSKRGSKLYVKPIGNGERRQLRFGFIFQKLYLSSSWQVFHAILDETLHLFTVSYSF